MENIKIEEIRNYLGYKLHFEVPECKAGYFMDGLNSDTIKLKHEKYIGFTVSLNTKPIVRPLSQLTQEIEHNGEKFIPIVELFKIEFIDEFDF